MVDSGEAARLDVEMMESGGAGQLDFISSGTLGQPESLQGSISPVAPENSDSDLGSKAYTGTAQFFQKKGFGWLLEVDETGEEEKPLLYVFRLMAH